MLADIRHIMDTMKMAHTRREVRALPPPSALAGQHVAAMMARARHISPPGFTLVAQPPRAASATPRLPSL